MTVQLVSMLTFSLALSMFQAPVPTLSKGAHRVTVIGCVKRSGPDSAATGTTILLPGQTRYVLVNVTLAANADQTATAELIAERVPLYRLAASADPTVA